LGLDIENSVSSLLPDEPALSGRAWVKTLVAAWLAQFISMTGFCFAMPFIPFYLRDLGVQGEAAQRYWSGAIISAPALVMIVVAPLWGVLADRFGRKLMVMRAMFGGAAVVALMGAARSPMALLMLRLLQGGITGTVSATNALVSGVSPRNRAGFSLGLTQTAIYAGSSLGPLLGGVSADSLGHSATFYIAGGLLLLGGIVVGVLANEGPVHPRSARTEGAAPAEGLWDVLARPGFAVVVGLVFMLQFVGTVLGPIFPLYVEALGLDKLHVNTDTGKLMAVTAIAAALVAVPTGWIADRIGPGRVLVLGTLLSGTLIIPQAFVTSIGSLYIIRVALGLAAGTIGPSMGSFVNRAVPRASQGKAFGIVQSASSLGFGLGPLTGGVMGALLGLRQPFVVVGAMQVLFALVAWAVLSSRKAVIAIPQEQAPASSGADDLPIGRRHD
jgi:DHA1 family multidrug resistance protein-like MFS transporter